jgi:lipopolysaccharide transport protein LptA
MRSALLAASLLLGVLAAARGGPGAACAAETASTPGRSAPPAPIHIQAEQLMVDMNANTAQFSGRVRLTQEGTVITADLLTIHYTNPPQAAEAPATRDLSTTHVAKMVAQGQVDIQLANGAAAAQEAIYEPEADRLTLCGPDAFVASGGSTLTGQRVVFIRKEGRLTAEGKPPERVVFTLLPAPKRP